MNAESMGRRMVGGVRRLASHCGDPGRAVRTFETCVSIFDSSVWPKVAWSFSGLTPDGSPMEFGFSSRSNALRYTVEVGGPELDNGLRLSTACAMMVRLGHEAPPARLIEQWQAVQSGMPLQWGAWLGIRNAESPGTREDIKIYVEVPVASAWRPSPAGATPGGRLLMVGFEPSSCRTEYYYRKPRMNRSELDILLKTLAGGEQREAMLGAFAGLSDMPLETALRWLAPAYSVAYVGEEPGGRLSLFIRARNVGPMHGVRRKMLDAIQRCGQRSSAYSELFADVAADDLPDHDAITLTIERGNEVEMRVGISGTDLVRREVS